ncbi:unnamed protein product [Amoebophrya sp. A25]|nr:unnamed protein product [Amoebophrya sp. A25]|eukprot:GSA25T00000260001.1
MGEDEAEEVAEVPAAEQGDAPVEELTISAEDGGAQVTGEDGGVGGALEEPDEGVSPRSMHSIAEESGNLDESTGGAGADPPVAAAVDAEAAHLLEDVAEEGDADSGTDEATASGSRRKPTGGNEADGAEEGGDSAARPDSKSFAEQQEPDSPGGHSLEASRVSTGDAEEVLKAESSSSEENGESRFLRDLIKSVISAEIVSLRQSAPSETSVESVFGDPMSMEEDMAEEHEKDEEEPEEEEEKTDGRKSPPSKKGSKPLGAKRKAKSKAKASKAESKAKAKQSKASAPGSEAAGADAAPGGEDADKAGDGAAAADARAGDATGAQPGEASQVAAPIQPQFDLDKLRDEIRDIVRVIWKEEVTVESKNEKQLLDILRLRDSEVIRAHEKVAEVTGLLLAADKTLEAMKAQVKDAEKEKDALHDRMIAARVTEQKATTIVDANTKRSNDLARDLEVEKKRRLDERMKLEGMVEQAKEDHRVEVMAYRRALSTEEAKVVSLQRELKECRERIAELGKGGNGTGLIGALNTGGSSKFYSTGSGSSKAYHGNRGAKGKKKNGTKSVESIYTPLSSTMTSLPKINNSTGGFSTR